MLEDGHEAVGDGVIGDADADVEREDGVDEEVEKRVELGLEESPDAEARGVLFRHTAVTSLAGWRRGEVILTGHVS